MRREIKGCFKGKNSISDSEIIFATIEIANNFQLFKENLEVQLHFNQIDNQIHNNNVLVL